MNPPEDTPEEHARENITAAAPASKSPSKTKKILASVGSLITFVLAFNLTQWVYDEIKGEYDERKTLNNTAEYFSDTSTWKEFNSPVGRFKATFPSYPAHQTENVKIPKTEIELTFESYSSKSADGTVYSVNTATYPPEVDTSKPDLNLEGSLNGMLNAKEGNQLVSSNLTYFDGHRTLEFHIKSSDDENAKGKVILAGQTFYQVFVIYQGKNANESDYNKFMSSFALQ